MTIAEAVQQAYEAHRAAGIPDARREAEILVAACLKVERARLIAYPDAPLSPAQQRRLDCWLRRRANREPLAYITRRAWFYGLDLTVGRGVLIPRPETEVLVELFLEWTKGARGTMASSPSSSVSRGIGLSDGRDAVVPSAPAAGMPSRQAADGRDAVVPVLVDAGTGTGAIVLACLQHAPYWRGVGIDRSRRALHIAQLNRRKLGLESRLWLVQSDWLRCLRPQAVDAILSNPPYVLPDEWGDLQPEITRYEPRSALLVPEADPLLPYRQIAEGAKYALRSPGLLALETSPRLAPDVAECLAQHGFASPQIRPDYSGTARVVWAVI